MNIGAQSGLVDPKHEAVMGNAVWLYLWCLWRQTRRTGLVLGGMPLTYEEISKRSGFGKRKVVRWMATLRSSGYVEIAHTNYKAMRIRILKSKKFNFKQCPLPFQNQTENAPEPKTKNGRWVIPKTVFTDTKNGLSNKSGSLTSTETPEKAPLTLMQNLGVPLQLWVDYRKMRAAIRRPIVEGAEYLIFTELANLQSQGESPPMVLQQAIITSSYSLYPVRKDKYESFQERRSRTSKQGIKDIFDGDDGMARAFHGALPPAD